MTSAILDATYTELAEGGYAALTIDAVAERAGVHRASIYRRWPDKEALLVDALLAWAAVEVPLPDAGSLEADLRSLLHSIAANLAQPVTRALLRVAAAESESSADIARIARAFWSQRIRRAAGLVTRAQERGEVVRAVDPERFIETLIAPLFLRLLVTGQEADSAFADQLVDDALRAIRGTETAV